MTGFTADGPIESYAVTSDDKIFLSDGLGRIHFLKLVEPDAKFQSGYLLPYLRLHSSPLTRRPIPLLRNLMPTAATSPTQNPKILIDIANDVV